jgi:hypothetical protein
MLLFEVILESGQLTPEEAEKVGFHGIPADPHGRPRRLSACQRSDQRRIQNALEASAAVLQMALHEVG